MLWQLPHNPPGQSRHNRGKTTHQAAHRQTDRQTDVLHLCTDVSKRFFSNKLCTTLSLVRISHITSITNLRIWLVLYNIYFLGHWQIMFLFLKHIWIISSSMGMCKLCIYIRVSWPCSGPRFLSLRLGFDLNIRHEKKHRCAHSKLPIPPFPTPLWFLSEVLRCTSLTSWMCWKQL